MLQTNRFAIGSLQSIYSQLSKRANAQCHIIEGFNQEFDTASLGQLQPLALREFSSQPVQWLAVRFDAPLMKLRGHSRTGASTMTNKYTLVSEYDTSHLHVKCHSVPNRVILEVNIIHIRITTSRTWPPRFSTSSTFSGIKLNKQCLPHWVWHPTFSISGFSGTLFE